MTNVQKLFVAVIILDRQWTNVTLDKCSTPNDRRQGCMSTLYSYFLCWKRNRRADIGLTYSPLMICTRTWDRKWNFFHRIAKIFMECHLYFTGWQRFLWNVIYILPNGKDFLWNVIYFLPDGKDFYGMSFIFYRMAKIFMECHLFLPNGKDFCGISFIFYRMTKIFMECHLFFTEWQIF